MERVIPEERHSIREALLKRQVTLGQTSVLMRMTWWKGRNPQCRREKYKSRGEICN